MLEVGGADVSFSFPLQLVRLLLLGLPGLMLSFVGMSIGTLCPLFCILCALFRWSLAGCGTNRFSSHYGPPKCCPTQSLNNSLQSPLNPLLPGFLSIINRFPSKWIYSSDSKPYLCSDADHFQPAGRCVAKTLLIWASRTTWIGPILLRFEKPTSPSLNPFLCWIRVAKAQPIIP